MDMADLNKTNDKKKARTYEESCEIPNDSKHFF